MLSVSIVTYHTPIDTLATCIEGLAKAKSVSSIMVVDNSRCVDTETWCSRQKTDITYVPNENVGYGAAHNLAVKMRSDKYHLVINPDVNVEPNVIDEMVEYLERHSDVGIAQPKVLNQDNTPQYSCRMLPTPFDLIGRRFLPDRLTKRRNDRYLLKHLDLDSPQNVPYMQGSFMMFRTEAFNQSGGFDERFFLYPEDIDITRRIHRDYKTLYLPMWSIIHHHVQASYHNLRLTLVHMANMIKYFNKWGWFFDKERLKFNNALMHKNKSGRKP